MAVIFDLFHTLVNGDDEERDRVVARMAGIVGVDPAGLVAAYHATWQQRLVEWSAQETLRTLAGRLGGTPTDAQVAEALALRLDLATRILARVSPATLGVLGALRAEGRPLALISNATSEAAEVWPSSPLAEYFDVAVFSCTERVAKPNREIYLAALAGLGNPDPTGCIYVGDGASGELAAAAALGMTVIRTTEHNDTDPTWQGPVIAMMADLPRLLRPAEPAI